MSNSDEILPSSARGERFFVSIADALGTANPFESSKPFAKDTLPECPSKEDCAPASAGDNDSALSLSAPILSVSQNTDARGEAAYASRSSVFSELLTQIRSASVPVESRRTSAAFLDVTSIANKEQIKLVQSVFLSGTLPARLVVFSGVEAGDGCSRICAETAVTLASHISGNVCVVDADLQFPSLHYYFGLKNVRGFGEAMLEHEPVAEYSHRLGASNLGVITSGTLSPNRHKSLTVKVLRPRLRELREAFDFVLIDAPPISSSASAHSTKLGISADGLVLVMGANLTRRETAERAKQDLEAANCNILGAVLNRRTFPIPSGLYRWL